MPSPDHLQMPSDKTVDGGDDAFNTFFQETGAGKHVSCIMRHVTSSCIKPNSNLVNPLNGLGLL